MNRIVAAALAAVLALTAAAPALAYSDEEQQELQIGQQVYQQLQQKGEIVRSSPDYTTLNSIAARIKPVADRNYFVPFHFILVNEKSPNAFSVPGGNVYVTTSMMRFVHNKEELAGVLCHEVNHDIHHDVYNLYAKEQRLSLYAGLASILFGRNSDIVNTGINLAANLQALHFSRDVEHSADHGGAYTCAQAGITPYAMIWLMQQFEANPSGTPPEFLSDHPSDSHRIGALQSEFSSDPSTFSRFNQNIACSTPIGVAGWNDQYQGGCGRRQQTGAAPRSRSRSGARPIAPVAASSKPRCPSGWKFC
ncbi:MAG: M48 family metallopeptidase [Candidatus Baltobacteraceae bacterium]